MRAISFLILFLASSHLLQSEAGEQMLFERDVRPILKTHCFECHGDGEKLRGDVDLRLRRFMLKKTDDGPVLVPGKPKESLIVKMIESGEMPKNSKKVSSKDLATITKWVATGAHTSRPEPSELPKGFYITEEERSFWAFQPIRQPAVPALKRTAHVRNPVDAFVLAKLKEQKLEFAPEAPRLALTRRACLDLTGLPPTPEQIGEALADTDPDWYEKMIDRLLDSPRYGERWGRYWLDAAGYSDSNGYTEADSVRPHAWRYRDYVINSFNKDKPWDRFIIEQLAGDELAGVTAENAAAKARDPRSEELLAATGFLRMGPDGTGDSVPDANLARNQAIAETLKIVSTSLLGLTVGCAQCHDHRYDPISQADYHRFRAIFEPAYNWKDWRNPAQRLVSLYTDADRAKAAEIEAAAKKFDESSEKMRKEFLEKVFERELKKAPEEKREALKAARNTPRNKRTPEQAKLLKEFPAVDVQGALDLYDPESNKKVLEEKAKGDKLRGGKPPEPFLMALTEPAGKVPESFVFNRGDHDQPRQKVTPNEIEILRPAGAELAAGEQGLPTSGRRLAYARWLASGQHPLLARVLVNRFWMHHFGRGLVNTPGDFGKLGERPSHPELLDWLAAEFMRNRWQLKPLHRLLMTSTAYRQGSRNETSLKKDPDNRFYGRMKMRRLDAEALRDSILAASGGLALAEGGPAIPVARDAAGRVVVGSQKVDGNGDPVGVDAVTAGEFRRSVYVQTRRTKPLTVLEAFDFPVMSPNCEQRPQTTVAPQSLLLMNDSFLVAQSQRMAERLRKEAPGDIRAEINLAWRLLYGVPATSHEMAESVTFLAEQTESVRAQTIKASAAKKEKLANPPDPSLESLASLCQILLSANRFLYVD